MKDVIFELFTHVRNFRDFPDEFDFQYYKNSFNKQNPYHSLNEVEMEILFTEMAFAVSLRKLFSNIVIERETCTILFFKYYYKELSRSYIFNE
jgi:hypothetical protein